MNVAEEDRLPLQGRLQVCSSLPSESFVSASLVYKYEKTPH